MTGYDINITNKDISHDPKFWYTFLQHVKASRGGTKLQVTSLPNLERERKKVSIRSSDCARDAVRQRLERAEAEAA